MERVGSEEAYGRITVWPPSGGGPGVLPATAGGCMILVAPINGPSEMILSAANIGIARGIGRDHWALPYDLKHGNYLPSLWGAREARSRGLDDVILCRRDGSPVEASASNLVLLCGDRWVTPFGARRPPRTVGLDRTRCSRGGGRRPENVDAAPRWPWSTASVACAWFQHWRGIVGV